MHARDVQDCGYGFHALAFGTEEIGSCVLENEFSGWNGFGTEFGFEALDPDAVEFRAGFDGRGGGRLSAHWDEECREGASGRWCFGEPDSHLRVCG